MEKLAHGWCIAPHWASYLLSGLLLQSGVRLFMSALSAIALTHRSAHRSYWRLGWFGRFWVYFYRCFIGFHPDDHERNKSDLWFTSILGLLELWSYPVLMATGAWTVIGAWLGFKTLAQWKSWSDDRVTFNHYLIGNAIVVLLSLLVLVPYVKVSAAECAGLTLGVDFATSLEPATGDL